MNLSVSSTQLELKRRTIQFILSPKRFAFFGICAFVFTVFAVQKFNLGSVYAAPGINERINFQGKVVNADGTNVTDGNYEMVFRLYTQESGGSDVWTETWDSGNSEVSVNDGIFRVELGRFESLSGIDFNADEYWLSVEFNGDGEMEPRIRFAAVPYAFNAKTVSGLTVTNTTGTFTLTDAKTFTVNNTLGLSGTDGTTFTFPDTSDTVVTLTATQTLTNKTIGSTGLVFSGATTDISTVSDEDLAITPGGAGSIILTSDSNSGVLVGSSSNTPAVLSVSGGIGNNAAFIIDQLNSGDLFTASAAGVTKLTISSTGALTSSAYGNDGGILYTSTTGLISQTAGGSDGNCLTFTGGAPAWGDCGSGAGGSNWVLNPSTGILSPINNSLDLLVGSTATDSAKFAVLNIAGGTPTASISANSGNIATYITGDGTLATTNRQSLIIGNSTVYDTTGNVLINPNGVGRVAVGTSTPSYPIQLISDAPDTNDGRILDVDGDLTSSTNDQSGFKISPAVVPNASTARTYSGGVFSVSGNNNSRLTNATFRGFDAQASYSGSSGTLGTAMGGRYVIFNTGTGTITNAYGIQIDSPTNAGTLTNTRGIYIASQSVGTQTNTPYGIYQEGASDYNYFAGRVGIGATTPRTKLDIQSTGNLAIFGSDSLADEYIAIRSATAGGVFFGLDASLNDGSGAGLIQGGANKGLAFQTNDGTFGNATTPDMYIDTSGNVGINTVTPTALLDVAGTASVSGAPTGRALLTLNQAGTQDIFTASSSGVAKFSITNAGGIKLGASEGTSGQCLLSGGVGAGSSWGSCGSGSSQWTTTGSDIYYNTGNVGIGTNNPSQLLHLYNNTNGISRLLIENPSTGGSAQASIAMISGSYEYQFLVAQSVGDAWGIWSKTANSNIFAVKPDFGYGGALKVVGTNNQANDTFWIGFNHSNFNNFADSDDRARIGVNIREGGAGRLFFTTGLWGAQQTRMWISDVGNVGVGTTSPISALHVSRPVSFGVSGKALGIFDQTENQDILTASDSGATRFTITRAGGIKLGAAEGSSGNCLKSGGTGSAASWGDCVALLSNDGTGATSSDSGLEQGSGGIGLLQGCSDEQVLKWDDANEVWECGSDRATFQNRLDGNFTMSGTTFADVDSNSDTNDNMGFVMGANETWIFQMNAAYQSPTAADMKWQVSGTNSPTCDISFSAFEEALNVSNVACGASSGNMIVSAAAPDTMWVSGTIAANGSGSTIQLMFGQATTSGTSTVFMGSYVIAYKITGADLAENYYTTESPPPIPGTILSVDEDLEEGVERSNVPYDRRVMGIVTTKPGLVMGEAVPKEGASSVLVALSGRVPVRVNTENGIIKAGDYITSSSTPGVGMKATKAGAIVAQALTGYAGEGEGKIMAMVRTSYSQGASIASLIPGLSDDLTQSKDNSKKILEHLLSNPVEENESLSEIFTDRVVAGLEIVTPKLTAQEIDVSEIAAKTASISGTLTADVIRANRIEGLEFIESDVSALADSLATHSASLATSLQELTIQQEEFNKEVKVISQRLEKYDALNLLSLTPFASSSSEFAVIKDGLAVLGTTTLNEASIHNTLSIGNSMVFNSTSVNVIGDDFEVQSLRQGGISFLGGLISFTSDGKATFKEDVVFEKNVGVAGVLSSKTSSFNDLAVEGSEFEEISNTEARASSSAGTAFIAVGQTKRKILHPLVREDSLIYITPLGRTFGQYPYVAEQEDGESFTVAIEEDISLPLKFNYLIINRRGGE